MKRKQLSQEDTFPNKKIFSIQFENLTIQPELINTTTLGTNNNQFYNPCLSTQSTPEIAIDRTILDPPLANNPYVNLKRKSEPDDNFFAKRKKLHDNEKGVYHLANDDDDHIRVFTKEYICYKHDHDKQICGIYECIGSRNYNMPSSEFKEPCSYIS